MVETRIDIFLVPVAFALDHAFFSFFFYRTGNAVVLFLFGVDDVWTTQTL